MNPKTLLQQLPETVSPDVRERVLILINEIESAKKNIEYYEKLIPAIEREIKELIAPKSAVKETS